jgi:hypothetical protein
VRRTGGLEALGHHPLQGDAFVIGPSPASPAGLFASPACPPHTNSFTFVGSIEIIMVVLGGWARSPGRGGGHRALPAAGGTRPVKDYRMVTRRSRSS